MCETYLTGTNQQVTFPNSWTDVLDPIKAPSQGPLQKCIKIILFACINLSHQNLLYKSHNVIFKWNQNICDKRIQKNVI